MYSLRGSAAVLMALTALTVLGVVVIDAHRTVQFLGPQLWVTVVLVTAFGKVAAIGYWFMELRAAPPLLRIAFFGWCAVFGAAVLILTVW